MSEYTFGVIGWYGHGNVGDDALLQAICGQLKQAKPNSSCLVLCDYPDVISRKLGLPAIKAPVLSPKSWARSPLSSIGAFRDWQRFDVFVLGGGGFFADDVSMKNVVKWSILMFVAKAMGKRIIAFALGIGPLKNTASRALARAAFNGADVIAVRDEESREWLLRSGVSRPINVVADPAVLLEPADADVSGILAKENIPDDRPLVGISVPPFFHDAARWPGERARWENFQASWRTAIDCIITLGARPVLIPMQHSPPGYSLFSDIELADCLIQGREQACVLRGDYQPDVIAAIMGKMDLVVGMRLHAVILAASAGIPVVGVSYHHKVRCLVERLGIDGLFVDVWAISPEAMKDIVTRGWNSRAEIKRKLDVTVAEMKRESAKTGVLVREFLQEFEL